VPTPLSKSLSVRLFMISIGTGTDEVAEVIDIGLSVLVALGEWKFGSTRVVVGPQMGRRVLSCLGANRPN
jgi:hypothetical protein